VAVELEGLAPEPPDAEGLELDGGGVEGVEVEDADAELEGSGGGEVPFEAGAASIYASMPSFTQPGWAASHSDEDMV